MEGGGGATKWEGWHVKFYPYQKKRGGGVEQVLAMLKGAPQNVLGYILRSSLKFKP